MPLRILFQDKHIIAVDKPAGFYVHPPEDGKKISHLRSCLHILRDQIGEYVHPIHRLDRATSGVLLFARESSVARDLHALWKTNQVGKVYICLARGYLEKNIINEPLANKRGELQRASTLVYPIFQKEINAAIGPFPTSRYTLALASPVTGRFHQIRRHLAHISHPIIGDKAHGDNKHNRFFETELTMPSLHLRAMHLSFPHPRTGENIKIEATWDRRWHKVFDWLGLCPAMKRWQSFPELT